MKYFQSNLKYLLKSRGLKSKDFALEMGWTKESLSSYATGRVVPKFDQVLKMAEYFNVTADDFAYVDLSTTEGNRSKNIHNDGIVNELLLKEVMRLREEIARKGDPETNRQADEAVNEAINTLRQKRGDK